MRRLILILNCLAIFYAGMVWAFEGCGEFDADVNAPRQSEKRGLPHHHESDAAPHHTHSDPSKVHCPNVLGEFLISSRATLTSEPGYVSHAGLAGESVKEFLSDMISGGFGDGPPSSVYSKDLPRYLLLSVIRI